MASSKHSTPSDPSESTHLELSNGGNTTTTTTSSKTTQIKKTRPIIHLVLALSLSIFFVVIAVAGKNGRQRLKSSYYQTDSANSVVELDIFGMQNFPGNDEGCGGGYAFDVTCNIICCCDNGRHHCNGSPCSISCPYPSF
mmetsp:Transcript_29395/g.33002  ORF Transcript_29395/g.33002 Transcript_29395/m.33002 type:complete len:140 (+) Transcript_29395:113-532(+)